MIGSRLKCRMRLLIGLVSRYLPVFRRSNLILYFALFCLISFVIAWECLHFSTAADVAKQSESEIVFYIGDVPPGSKSHRNVPIQNKTKSPLTITSVSRSCSCLAVGLDRNTIQPGEVASLDIEFLTPERQGGFRHELMVRFREDHDPIIIRLMGTVSAWIRSSVSVLEFKGAFPGEVKRQLLQLKVLEPWPEEQRRLTVHMPYTRIESTAMEDDGKAISYTIAFHPPAGAESKVCEGDFVVDWIGRKERSFKLPCKGHIASEWVADPPQVVLGRLALYKRPAFTVRIRNQRHAADIWGQHYKVDADSSALLEVSSTWDGDSWHVTGSVREKGLLHAGVKSGALCVTAPDGMVQFRVPVYWEIDK